MVQLQLIPDQSTLLLRSFNICCRGTCFVWKCCVRQTKFTFRGFVVIFMVFVIKSFYQPKSISANESFDSHGAQQMLYMHHYFIVCFHCDLCPFIYHCFCMLIMCTKLLVAACNFVKNCSSLSTCDFFVLSPLSSVHLSTSVMTKCIGRTAKVKVMYELPTVLLAGYAIL